MAEYVLVFKGGSMPQGDEEKQKVMEAWNKWFGALGQAVVDQGNPFGPSKGVTADGSVGSAASGLTGYAILKADNLDQAVEMAKGCPVLAGGASVEVYETFPVM